MRKPIEGVLRCSNPECDGHDYAEALFLLPTTVTLDSDLEPVSPVWFDADSIPHLMCCFCGSTAELIEEPK